MDDLEPAANGAFCTVRISRRARKEMRKAQAHHLGRCKRIIEKFAEEGPESLTDTMFVFEDRFAVGPRGDKVPVYAFKSFNLRVYGSYHVNDGKIFLCTHAVIKKKDEADRDLLERVAREVWELCNV